MSSRQLMYPGTPALLLGLLALPAGAQSFRVQCPTNTITHPIAGQNSTEPNYTGATTFSSCTPGQPIPNSSVLCPPSGTYPSGNVNGGIKCQQVSGGDGFATMADGTQTYMFSFGPLSGLADIAAGKPGTQPPNVFNTLAPSTPQSGDPIAPTGANPYTHNGAIGLAPDNDCLADGTCTAANSWNPAVPGIDGHVDPRQIMDVGVMNGNQPAPLMAIDEGDEFFLTLTNAGMIMRPDLFEQHTIHFHGYPNASSLYDGVPDASVAINLGGSFTYYYLAPDAGTYFLLPSTLVDGPPDRLADAHHPPATPSEQQRDGHHRFRR